MRATQALFRRVRHFPFTTKTAPRGYYKGTRSGSMGEHVKGGRYAVDYDKVRSYVVPANLDECKLTPFVTKKVQAMRGGYDKDEPPFTGAFYLNKWKEENGED